MSKVTEKRAHGIAKVCFSSFPTSITVKHRSRMNMWGEGPRANSEAVHRS